MKLSESTSTSTQTTFADAEAARLRADCLSLAVQSGTFDPVAKAKTFLDFVMPGSSDPMPDGPTAVANEEPTKAAPFGLAPNQDQTGPGPFVHPFVVQSKETRKELDDVLQCLKGRMGLRSNMPPYGNITRKSRNRQLALEAIEEAIMRLGMDLKDLKEEGFDGAGPSPYPNSYDAKSPTIDPTADGLRL